MVRLVAFGAAALALLFIAAAIVGHWREQAVYKQLAEHNQHSSPDRSQASPLNGLQRPSSEPGGLRTWRSWRGATNRTGTLRRYFAEGPDLLPGFG